LKKLRKNYKGFTLIEVLVVLFIIAAMAIILLPNVMNQSKKAQETKDKIETNISNTNKELQNWESNNGE